MQTEQNILFKDIKELNNFLYKYFFLNLFVNLYLYFFPGINLALIFYSFSFIFFLIKFSKIYKDFYFCLFAQFSSLFLLNITYLNFIITVILKKYYAKQDFEIILNFFYYCDLKSYFLANSYLIVFVIILVFFSNFIKFEIIEKTINKLKSKNLNIDINKNYFLIIVCIIVESIYFFSGTLGSQLTRQFIINDPTDIATWYTYFYYFVVTFHLLLNLLLLKNKSSNKFKNIFLIISFILNFILYGFALRRMAVQFLFIAIIVYFFLSEIKIKRIKFFVVNVILISLLFQFVNFLQVIRTSEIYGIDKSQSLKEIIAEGKIFNYFTNQDMRRRATQTSIKNVSGRIFTNHELATIFYYEKNADSKFLYGKLLRNNLIKTIPRVFFPNKENYKITEILISTATNSPLYDYDTVDSLHSYSYVDFGLFGLIIYPILLIIIFLIFYQLINLKFMNSLTGLFIIMLFLPEYSMRVAETNINDWFVLIRNIFIFVLIFNYLLSSKRLDNIK